MARRVRTPNRVTPFFALGNAFEGLGKKIVNRGLFFNDLLVGFRGLCVSHRAFGH